MVAAPQEMTAELVAVLDEHHPGTGLRSAHRRCHTGGPAAGQVTEWLTKILQEQGALVSSHQFTYQHYQSKTENLNGSAPWDAELLFYSWTGDTVVSNPLIASIDAQGSEHGIVNQLTSLTAAAIEKRHDGVLAATNSQAGGLCGVNRAYQAEDKIPIILASPASVRAVLQSQASIRCRANCHLQQANNLVARFPAPQAATAASVRPAVVTTPISGWFQCAGERGTGLALAVSLANHLSSVCPIDLVLTRGHEIGYLGGYEFANEYAGPPTFVLHLGSCLANYGSQLECRYSDPKAKFDGVLTALAPLSAQVSLPSDPADETSWLGEAKCWASDGYPILSIAGQSRLFHTQADLPGAATSPELLAQAKEVLEAAALEIGLAVKK